MTRLVTCSTYHRVKRREKKDTYRATVVLLADACTQLPFTRMDVRQNSHKEVHSHDSNALCVNAHIIMYIRVCVHVAKKVMVCFESYTLLCPFHFLTFSRCAIQLFCRGFQPRYGLLLARIILGHMENGCAVRRLLENTISPPRP